MEQEIDHNKLLKKIAKDRLKLYGIVQKGQSRSFHCDKGWITFMIEFQPSSWSKGSYLNVGLDFHFYPREHFAYSYVNRVSDFIEFTDEEQFVKAVNELCDKAIKHFQLLERKFKDIWTAIETIEKEKEKSYYAFDLAILYALTGNYEQALPKLIQMREAECEFDWHFERRKVVIDLIEWIESDPATFLEKFKNQINETRKLKKLEPVNLDHLTERKKADSSKLKGSKRWLLKLFGFE